MVTHDPEIPENRFTKNAWKALFLSLPDPDAVHLRGPLSLREIARYKESYSAFANLFAEVKAVIPDDDDSELEVCWEIKSRVSADLFLSRSSWESPRETTTCDRPGPQSARARSETLRWFPFCEGGFVSPPNVYWSNWIEYLV